MKSLLLFLVLGARLVSAENLLSEATPPETLLQLSFLPSEEIVATSGAEAHWSLWDSTPLKLRLWSQPMDHFSRSAAASYAPVHVVTNGSDYEIGVFREGKPWRVLRADFSVTQVAISGNGRYVAAQGSSMIGVGDINQFEVWDLGKDDARPYLKLPVSPHVIAISEDGMRLAAGHTTGLSVYDGRANPEPIIGIWYVDPAKHSRYQSLAFSPDGNTIFTLHDYQNVEMWDVPTQTTLQTVKLPEDARAVAIGANGQRAAIVFDHSIRFYNLEKGLEAFHENSVLGHTIKTTDKIKAVAFSPNENKLALSTHKGPLSVWSTPEVPSLPPFTPLSDSVYESYLRRVLVRLSERSTALGYETVWELVRAGRANPKAFVRAMRAALPLLSRKPFGDLIRDLNAELFDKREMAERTLRYWMPTHRKEIEAALEELKKSGRLDLTTENRFNYSVLPPNDVRQPLTREQVRYSRVKQALRYVPLKFEDVIFE